MKTGSLIALAVLLTLGARRQRCRRRRKLREPMPVNRSFSLNPMETFS